jgi:tripartite-type tricarboxylate transporter receptor subunit TctC
MIVMMVSALISQSEQGQQRALAVTSQGRSAHLTGMFRSIPKLTARV